MKPLHDRVLLKRLDSEAVSPGGIVIPVVAQEKPIAGEVVAVGEGKRDSNGVLHSLTVRPGDRVLFGKYAGTEVKVDGVDHLIVREEDILGLI